jgi:transposase
MAIRFCVSGVFVEKLWQRWRRTGSSSPKPPAGGRHSALKDHLELLAHAVVQQPDATLAELRDRVVAAHGLRGSPATICRALQRLKLPVKKVAPRLGAGDRARPDAPPRVPRDGSTPRRPRLTFVAASGSTLAMSRRYGRAASG